jgi:hypothetical protein
MDNKSSRETFTIRANPVLHDTGALAGKLDYVRFTADSSNGTHKEWRLAASLLDKKLHVLESSGMRYGIVSKLQSGARADLPGTFSIKQLADLGLPDPR